MIIELIGHQKTLLKKYTYSSQLLKLKDLINEEKLLLGHITQIRNILNLQRMLMIELNETGMPVQNESDVKRIKLLLLKLKGIRLNEGSSYQAETILSHALIAAYLSLNNFKSAYKVSLSLLEFLNKNKTIVNKDPKNKYAVVHNLVFILLMLNDRIKTLKYLDTLNNYCGNLPKNISNETKNNLLCNLYIINIKADCKFFHIQNRQKYFNDLNLFYLKNKEYIISKDYINIVIVMVTNFIVNSEWQNALEKNNTLLSKGNKLLSNEQVIAANLNDLVIHYELKNYDYLFYKTTGVKNLLKKANKKDSVEYYLVELLCKLLNTDDKIEKKYILEDFRQKAKEKLQSPAISLFIAENYFMEWVYSIIGNIDLKSVILNSNNH